MNFELREQCAQKKLYFSVKEKKENLQRSFNVASKEKSSKSIEKNVKEKNL